MENLEQILTTLLLLIGILLGLSFVALQLIQYLKAKWGIENKAAEVVSLVVGFLLSALIGWVYVDAMGWQLTPGQIAALVLFVVVGTIAPSGGYKFLKEYKPIAKDGPTP